MKKLNTYTFKSWCDDIGTDGRFDIQASNIHEAFTKAYAVLNGTVLLQATVPLYIVYSYHLGLALSIEDTEEEAEVIMQQHMARDAEDLSQDWDNDYQIVKLAANQPYNESVLYPDDEVVQITIK